MFRILLKSKVILKALVMGKRNPFKSSSFAPLTLISLLIFIKQVRKLEKYIIPIKPFMPKYGNTASTSPIRKDESKIPVRKQNPCWSSPFKIPSATLSRYIKGTMGDKAHIRNPTSSLL